MNDRGWWKAAASVVVAAMASACAQEPVEGPSTGDVAHEEEALAAPMEARARWARPSATIDSFDRSGILRTYARRGAIDTSNPFFASLGTNGRSCASCHVAESGWTITPDEVQRRFEATAGRDPLFRTNDGAVSPRADVSTLAARRDAYRLLLSRGLIRTGMPIPENAEFELAAVDDPYGFASANELSLFRRPLPSTNLDFLTAVMWDGRETLPGRTIHFDLEDQANGATRGHGQADHDLTDAQREAIVDFETSLTTAQIFDFRAGDLRAKGATGGPEALAAQPFFPGINDPLGGNPTGAPFDPDAFALFAAWTGGGDPAPSGRGCDADRAARWLEEGRASVARGEALFGQLPISIEGVAGLNDELGMPTIAGHCTTCHDAPNVGDHSLPLPIDIGIADAARRTPDMPLYTLRRKADGALVQTTDPGRALVTGRWKDVGKFKGPVLRGLAARAPYFHDGSAARLEDVVDFYDGRFRLGLTPQDRADLIAFLRAL